MTRLGLRRPAALAALVLALSPTLAACSGGDSSTAEEPAASDSSSSPAASDEAVADIAESFRSGAGEDVVSEEDAQCFAQTMVDELGEDTAREVSEAADPTTLPQDQQKVVVDGLNECVSPKALAEPFTTQFYASFGAESPPSPQVVSCIAQGLEGHSGDLLTGGEAISSGGPIPDSMLQALEDCVPDDVIAAQFVKEFSSQGIPEPVAKCIANDVVDDVSLTQLIEIGMAKQATLPPEFRKALQDALAACG